MSQKRILTHTDLQNLTINLIATLRTLSCLASVTLQQWLQKPLRRFMENYLSGDLGQF